MMMIIVAILIIIIIIIIIRRSDGRVVALNQQKNTHFSMERGMRITN
jgi:hypothetical protein